MRTPVLGRAARGVALRSVQGATRDVDRCRHPAPATMPSTRSGRTFQPTLEMVDLTNEPEAIAAADDDAGLVNQQSGPRPAAPDAVEAVQQEESTTAQRSWGAAATPSSKTTLM